MSRLMIYLKDKADVAQKVCKIRWKIEELPFGKTPSTPRNKAIDWY